MKTSNCCDALVNPNFMICADCKEPCDIVEDTPIENTNNWQDRYNSLFNSLGFDHIDNCGHIEECECASKRNKMKDFIEKVEQDAYDRCAYIARGVTITENNGLSDSIYEATKEIVGNTSRLIASSIDTAYYHIKNKQINK